MSERAWKKETSHPGRRVRPAALALTMPSMSPFRPFRAVRLGLISSLAIWEEWKG